ncbi:MAG: LanC-like protein [Gammaproteobacteria bacterium]
MLFDSARHEPLLPIAWDENAVRAAIARVVSDIERHCSPEPDWPIHPNDLEKGDDPDAPATPLYHGACGVIWALHYLEAVGAATLSRRYLDDLDTLLRRNRAWLTSLGSREFGAYMMGDVPILLLAYGDRPSAELAYRLAELIAGNLESPARELMWGSPGTLLAVQFLHERTGEERWANLFRATAEKLWTQLEWSAEYGCHYWTQALYGRTFTFLDGVHGFVATALPLIQGRHLLSAESWAAWAQCIATTIEHTATREGSLANWRPELHGRDPKRLMQYCHGAPGFVICLADFPGTALDELLVAAGEAIWVAGPLNKGSNLCHGTGGNGYAFLKLYQRTGNAMWLERARAFAMHAIAQTDAAAQRHGMMRYSLWTGDAGFAIYLWDCLRGTAHFPTLDVYYGKPRGG